MSIRRLFRKSATGRRSSYLAIVIFPDESTVFQAYRLLHYHGISPEHLVIVGQGYSSPERVGLMNPVQIIIRKAFVYAIGAGAISIIGAGITMLIGGLDQNIAHITIITSLLSVVTGAMIGAVLGLLGEGTAASIYRHHLRQGRYLLMMEGSENLVRWGQEVLGYYSAPSPH
ncbi:hypothetical protein [Leptodesmis sp.]|uniref:hypothetical protein n=1 Tax=Leptodesmis sp. TaxID=3100501 RepID=UPI0040534B14